MALTGIAVTGSNAYRNSTSNRTPGIGGSGRSGGSTGSNPYQSGYAQGDSGGLGGSLGGAIGQMGSAPKTGFWDSLGGGSAGGLGGDLGTAVGQMGSGYSNLSNAYGYYAQMYGPQMAQMMVSQAALYGNYGLSQGKIGLGREGLQADYQYGMRGADLDLNALEYDRALNMLGLRDNATDRGYYNQMKGLAGEGLNNRLADLMRQGVYDTRKNNSQFTASGGFFSPGRQFENTNIYNKTKLAGDAERIAHRREVAGIDRNLARLDVDDERIRIADKKFDIAAQKIGLRKEQLSSALELGLKGLGLDSQAAMSQLVNGLASNNAAQQELAMKIMMQALQSSGIFGANGPNAAAGDMYSYFVNGGYQG